MIKSDLFSRSNILKGVPLKSIYSDISGKRKFFSTGIISSFLESFRLGKKNGFKHSVINARNALILFAFKILTTFLI